MISRTAFTCILFVVFLLVCSTVSSAPTVPVPIDDGELIASYAYEDGGAVVVFVQHLLSGTSRLVTVYVNKNDEIDTLYQIDTSGNVDNVIAEVCGGRLHLTYTAGGLVWHATVNMPSVVYGYLPLVCRE